MTWIQTYTGRKFDLANPKAEDVDPIDIAHALSMLCRFTGHVRYFDSVAQHCVVVSQLVPREFALAGLLHDATEAYVADVNRPLKQMLPEYKVIENRVFEAIAERFGIDPVLPPEVHQADNISLMWEKRDLMGVSPEGWGPLEELLPLVPAATLTPWNQHYAEMRYTGRLRELTQ